MKNIEKITRIVAEHYGIPYWEIFKKSREDEILKPRQVAQYLIGKHTKNSQSAIARFFNQNHATVYNSQRVIREQLEIYREIRSELYEIEIVLSKNGLLKTKHESEIKTCNEIQMMIYRATA